MKDSSNERRKFKRIAPPPEQLIVYWHESNRMTMIMDIGKGGLKIECYHPLAGVNADSVTISLYAISADRFNIIGIPCRVAYDIANLVEGGAFSGSQSRLCGFEFQKLTTEQKEKLEHLLSSLSPDPGA